MSSASASASASAGTEPRSPHTVHSTLHTGRGEISQLQVTHIESDIGQQLGISGWIAAIAIHMAIGNMASYFKIDQVHTTCYKYRRQS